MSLEKLIDLDRLSRFKNELVALIPQIDTTLTQQGQAADAKATGDALNAKQPKTYTFSVFHDTNEGADPEYAVINAPGTIGELTQSLNETPLALSVYNYDEEELYLSTGRIAGALPIIVLFSDISPSASSSEEGTFIITGATAMGAVLVGNHETFDDDATITWQYMPLASADLLTQHSLAAYRTAAAQDVIDAAQDTAIGGKLSATGNAYRAVSIPFGQLDSTSTSTVMTATVPGITELRDGVCVWLTNGVITSASGFTLNINNLGAKPCYSSLAAASRSTTIFNVNYTMLFVYNSTRVDGGCWDVVYGYDSNTNTIGYQLRTNGTTLPMSSVTYRYRLLFTSADGTHFVPANNSTSTNATASRTVCQTPINPHGPIFYYGTTASVAANANPSGSYLWTRNTVTLGYSFNRTGAALVLSVNKPVYIKAAPQTNGSAIIDADTPYVQDLPATDDGKIYIFLGVTTSATVVELVDVHPIYCNRNGRIQIWTGVEAEIDALKTQIAALDILDEEEF